MNGVVIHFLFNPDELTPVSKEPGVWVFESASDAAQRDELSRCVIGRHLGIDPSRVNFEKDPHGRAFVAGAKIDVSLSHAPPLFAIGVSSRGRIGVDIEIIRGDMDFLAIAREQFTPAEQTWLENLPAPQRAEAFFRIWTVKEAFTKAIGHGLSFGFDQVETAASPDGTVRLIRVLGSAANAQGWEISHTRIGGPFPAILAAAAGIARNGLVY